MLDEITDVLTGVGGDENQKLLTIRQIRNFKSFNMAPKVKP